MPNAQSSSCSSPAQPPSYPIENSLTSLLGTAIASSQQDASQLRLPTFQNNNNNNRSSQDLSEVLGQVLEIMGSDFPLSMDEMDGFFDKRVASSPHAGAKQ
ncbi:unnamed protein product [Cylindrotheca closterium]|uniref:Uncharacterized protein n=1 Tax=Cylindrotheca closterium TaxID=2856 RepID=A0AAD2GC64_9STRA|nr:unnamed protein product [Cylindrotheca closterium]